MKTLLAVMFALVAVSPALADSTIETPYGVPAVDARTERVTLVDGIKAPEDATTTSNLGGAAQAQEFQGAE